MDADVDVLAVRFQLDVRAWQREVKTEVFNLTIVDADLGERVEVIDVVRVQCGLGVEELLQVLQRLGEIGVDRLGIADSGSR